MVFDGHPLFFSPSDSIFRRVWNNYRHRSGKIQAKINVGRRGLELKYIQ